jgi:hypothetical protein
MGIMVMNSSEIEVLLSGAQQRYEESFNLAEGASSMVSPPHNSAAFDPQNNIDADVQAVQDANPETWPSDDVFPGDATTAYRYYVTYEKWDTIRKGYDASNRGELSEYFFSIDVTNWNVPTQTFNARIETGNTRMGPKPNLVVER